MNSNFLKKNKENLILIAVFSLFFMAMSIQPVYATQLFDKAAEIMKDIYNNIIKISTISGVVCIAIALLMMNFSKSSKAVSESREWIKRIIIVWVVLNTLGFFIAYIAPHLEGGKWQAN